MPLSAVDAITPAFQHAREQLFKPFRAAQWAKLALVGMLAGETSSGGCNAGTNFSVPQHPSGSERFVDLGLRSTNPGLYIALIALLIVLGVVFWIFLMYVSSVMRFVLFDSILSRQCTIRRSWSRRTGAGLRYFGWQLLTILGFFVGLTILVGVPAAVGLALGWFKQPKEHLIPLILGGMVLFFLLLAFVVFWLAVYVFTKDFVVPQMALENIGAVEAWRRLLPMLKREKGGFAGYAGMKIVMAIAAAIVVGVITVIVVLLLLIPLGGVGAIAVLGGKAAGLSWNLYTITIAVIVGAVFIAILVYAISLISVPAIVFFPAYSIYFFAGRYPALQIALHPPAPPPVLSPPPFVPPEPIG